MHVYSRKVVVDLDVLPIQEIGSVCDLWLFMRWHSKLTDSKTDCSPVVV